MSVCLQDTTDPEIKRLFYQKLYTRPRQKAFTTLETGVESLRKGLNAFYTGSEAYQVMSDTYEESEKCRLKEISINPTDVLGNPVKKGSPYKEHITQKYVLLATHENSSDLDSKWFGESDMLRCSALQLKCTGSKSGCVFSLRVTSLIFVLLSPVTF
jgi:hypothetical protein